MTAQNIQNIDFLEVKFDKEGCFKDIEFKRNGLIHFLRSLGIARYNTGNDAYVYIQIEENVLEEIGATIIVDVFEDYLKSLPSHVSVQTRLGLMEISQELILEKFYRGMNTYLSDAILSRLRTHEEIEINKDTQHQSFLYFQNGFVEITKEGWNLKPYKDLPKYIWKSQIINRDFTKADIFTESEEDKSVFGRFMMFLANNDSQQFMSLASLMGYLMHDFYETKLKAVIFTDSSLSENPEGRTGKTLLGKAIEKVRSFTEISGKTFDPAYNHRYDKCNLSTQILHLNDSPRNLDFETLFTDITEGLDVNPKNGKSFHHYAKVMISTNKTIKLNGGSDKDRAIEFQLSNYFSHLHSPQDEFGHWFFRDWSNQEWDKFHNIMAYCIHIYLANGFVKPVNINLNRRKLIDECKQEFLDFMESDSLQSTARNEELKLEYEVWYDSRTLYERFKEVYSDFDKYYRQRTFNESIKKYMNYSAHLKEFNEFTSYKKSNSKYYFMFHEAERV